MQESRLFKIVYHLLDKGRATASELAEKFEVSVRTIYRDIDALSGAGIPIYAEAGRNGGIYLMNDFVMDKAVLTEEEKREILTALHSINSTSNMWRTTHIGQRQTRKPKRKTNLDKSKVVECCLSIGSKEFVNFLFSS